MLSAVLSGVCSIPKRKVTCYRGSGGRAGSFSACIIFRSVRDDSIGKAHLSVLQCTTSTVSSAGRTSWKQRLEVISTPYPCTVSIIIAKHEWISGRCSTPGAQLEEHGNRVPMWRMSLSRTIRHEGQQHQQFLCVMWFLRQVLTLAGNPARYRGLNEDVGRAASFELAVRRH